MAEKVRCVGRYINQVAGLVFQPGQIFDASSSLRDFLLADAPECFELYVPEVVEPEQPVKRARIRNKAILEPVKEK